VLILDLFNFNSYFMHKEYHIVNLFIFHCKNRQIYGKLDENIVSYSKRITSYCEFMKYLQVTSCNIYED